MKKIELTLSGELYDEMEKVAEATGIPMSVWIDDGIRSKVNEFRGSDGKVRLRKAADTSGGTVREVLVIGERDIFGHSYCRIWEKTSGCTMSVPAERITLFEE